MTNESEAGMILRMKPEHLKIFVGGYTGSSFGVRWEDGTLFYDRFDYGYELAETVNLQPDDDTWKEFWSTLDEIGVWQWNPKYNNPAILDGTNWSVELSRGDHNVDSQGSNCFPGNSSEDDSGPFGQFCEAVSKLAAGREFV